MQDYSKMSPIHYQDYYRKRMFTDTGQRAKFFNGGTDRLGNVSKTKGAIGYISAIVDVSTITSNVKMLEIKLR